jgi:pimeloyl-ACP methyl ester carboxylesterase
LKNAFKIFFIALGIIILPGALLSDTLQPVSGILHTSDNINISYDHYKRGFDSVIIICPGFFNSKDNRWMRRSVEMLSDNYDVIIFDFRGHGKSGGKYTWSAKEGLDLDAVMDYAVSCGYKHIGILGFSLGAAVAINEAAVRNDIESMVLISCPSSFQGINFHFWEPAMFSDLKDNIECKWDGKGARTEHIFMKKTDPMDSVRLIKNTAVFFIHGGDDWVIKDYHAKKLYDAAGTKKKLEVIKGGLHAERLIQFHYDGMRDVILDWFSKTLKSSGG